MSGCGCGQKDDEKRLLYSCSGCSDVGEIADISARELARVGFGKMACLAGVGAKLPDFIAAAKKSDENIVIDGCEIACGKKILDSAGVVSKGHILTQMGLVKGKTSLAQEVIALVCQKIANDGVEKPEGGCGSGGCESGECGCSGGCE